MFYFQGADIFGLIVSIKYTEERMDSGKKFGCLNVSSTCNDKAFTKSDLQPFCTVYPWISLGSVLDNNNDNAKILYILIFHQHHERSTMFLPMMGLELATPQL